MASHADTDFNMDDFIDFYADSDIMPSQTLTDASASQSHHVAQSVQHAESTPVVNAAGLGYPVRSDSLVYAGLHEQVSFNSTSSYTPSGHSALASIGETGTADTEAPRLKRPRTEDGDHFDMALGGAISTTRSSYASASTTRSSVISASTTRSSVMSASTGRSSMASMASMLMLSNPVDARVDEERLYECDVCHMGKGDPLRPYNRKEGNTPSGTSSADTPESNFQPDPRPAKPKNTYTTPGRLHSHIVARHIGFFQRTNSQELTCVLCPCGFVRAVPCGARFANETELLEHLTSVHSTSSKRRLHFNHFCPPLSLLSYSQELLNRLARRTGPRPGPGLASD